MTDKELYEKLKYGKKNVYKELSSEETKEMLSLADKYREFLDKGKTERECVAEAIKLAKENGFVPFEEKSELKAGDRIYFINRDKNIMLVVVGTEDIEKGLNIVGAHIDSPRLDLKQNPLYESDGMALFKTHYYGGIKKYQWTAIPLAIHGVICKKNGEKISVCIGEKDDDPVFTVTDLLPHLAKEQMSKSMLEGIEGEALNILVGGIGAGSDEISERVKFNILNILSIAYDITEEDFLSAELEVVPAFKARNVGLDNAYVGAYGQDDRVCAYTALKSIFDIETPERTAICLLVDKEEIGSVGNTGMLSRFFEMAVAELIAKLKGSCDMVTYNRTISASACLSSDVGAAFDPNYPSVSEKNNNAFAGNGLVLMKYTGARGKSEASDASAEFVSEIKTILDNNGIIWQTSELGKVDQGGGGTIAMYVGNLNMDVIDCGVPVLSMHSPFEITAKGDIYMAYKAYKAFYKDR
ncbi:MAG: aminopeptidase [Eubacteriales bacterium]|nr:aminopeptidase [Eubacteriales bacterium]